MQRSSPSFLFRALTLGLALLSASWAQAAEPFRLADTGILLYGLATLAEVQGDFKSQGLDLRRVPIVTGQDGLKALQSGQADAYLAADVAAAGQLQSEPGLRILASVGEWDNDDRVLARRDRGITRVEDLAGKRVGVQRGTSFHFLLDRLLARQGLTEADVRLVPMHTRDQLDALAQGKLDAIATRNSFQARAEALLGANLQVLDSKGVMVKSVLLITREDILRRRGDDFVALLRALNQAEQRARADLAGTAATLSAPMGGNAGETAGPAEGSAPHPDPGRASAPLPGKDRALAAPPGGQGGSARQQFPGQARAPLPAGRQTHGRHLAVLTPTPEATS
jgi:ABC-type nitrate/sulfonate/bicarbonate transport system substrate-binding protein